MDEVDWFPGLSVASKYINTFGMSYRKSAVLDHASQFALDNFFFLFLVKSKTEDCYACFDSTSRAIRLWQPRQCRCEESPIYMREVCQVCLVEAFALPPMSFSTAAGRI